jgi:Fic family protein
MQLVSGPIGKERVHYEAPAADRVRDEMKKILEWFVKDDSTDLVLKAGVAHLWFVTIDPFDDGNGRIARAIADMVLARSERQPAALLQHVGANPAGTQGLLRNPRSDAEGRTRYHALARMVP